MSAPLLTFHEWKSRQVDADSKSHGVFRYYRLREWYWAAYGGYCVKARKAE